MAEAVAYEEQRRRQIEANKRKLEELQLHHLSAAVREAAAAAKPSSVCPGFLTDSHDGRAVSRAVRCLLFCHSLGILYPDRIFLQAKKRKARVPRDAAAESLRRSGRLANLPEKPIYREVKVNSPFLQVSKSNARMARDAATSVVAEPLRWSGRLANLPEKPMYREVSVKGS
jgi:hypothetical protein